MTYERFVNYMKSGHQHAKDFYVSICLMVQLFATLNLSEKYGVKFVGVTGPSMCPTLDATDNLVLVDTFTTSFMRYPKKGEVIMASNPYKPCYTVIKRVLFTEGEVADFYSHKHGHNILVEVPKGHIWIEGDNKENSKDSRDFGPISLGLVEGIVRYRLYPFDKMNRV